MILRDIQRYGSTVYRSATLKASRSRLDVYSDRIRQAATEPTLMAFGERLANLMDVAVGDMNTQAVIHFMQAANGSRASGILRWIRNNHTLFAVLCAAHWEDADKAMEDLDIPTVEEVEDQALPRRPYHIGIRAKCLTPLSHGADGKSGNATLFRRMSVLGKGGSILTLPYYAGNAIRGQIRDLLADHFATAMGLGVNRANPTFALWFFHSIYAGGALEEASAATKALAKQMGDNGAIRVDGVNEFRDRLPALSLLGCAAGNKVLHGHLNVGDWRPVCREWGNGGGASVAEMSEWLYLTRRDDHEGRQEDDDHHGMIAVTETIKAGTTLEGGIDLRLHITDLSRSALGLGLRLLQDHGWIGAQNRADLGMVEIEIADCPDPEPYEAYLRENRESILEYLRLIGAMSDARAFSNR